MRSSTQQLCDRIKALSPEAVTAELRRREETSPLTLEDLQAMFLSPRTDHPGRVGCFVGVGLEVRAKGVRKRSKVITRR